YAQGQAMLGAAEGMAKGGEGGGSTLQGAGLGIGFGMAQAFQQGQQRPPATAAPAPVAAAGTPCPKCGTIGTGKFCGNCGAPLPGGGRRCAEGGWDLGRGGKFGGNCGKPVAG